MAIVIKKLEIILEVTSGADEKGAKAKVKSSNAEAKDINTPDKEESSGGDDCFSEDQLEELVEQITELLERRQRRY